MNPTPGKNYRGGNVLGLMNEAMQRCYEDPRWCMYKQASERLAGPQGREGHAHRVLGSEVRTRRTGRISRRRQPHSRLIHRTYTVFNAQQIDGIPELKGEPRKPFEVIGASETIP